jgi:hypothetical protein
VLHRDIVRDIVSVTMAYLDISGKRRTANAILQVGIDFDGVRTAQAQRRTHAGVG